MAASNTVPTGGEEGPYEGGATWFRLENRLQPATSVCSLAMYQRTEADYAASPSASEFTHCSKLRVWKVRAADGSNYQEGPMYTDADGSVNNPDFKQEQIDAGNLEELGEYAATAGWNVMQMPEGLIIKIIAVECSELNTGKPGANRAYWGEVEAYQELGWGPAAPPLAPPLSPPSAPPPPDCAAYDAQLDIVAATSAGARANPTPSGNNVGITVLSSDQGQARMQNDVTPGASLVRMEAGDYAMLDLGTSGDVCTIGLYQSGNKICPEINAYVCPSDSTSYTLASDCTHVGTFTGVNSQWTANSVPEGTTGRYIAVECTTLQGGENFANWNAMEVYAPVV